MAWSLCCLCGKNAGVGIEVAHLERNRSDIDNAIPLCFDCHGTIGHYNVQHPRGRKYSVSELKSRREQVYEQHTRHLVSPIQYRITQAAPDGKWRTFPDTGFVINNLGDTYPVRVRVVVTISQGARSFGHPPTGGHYDGRFLWNLNPRSGVSGHFDLPEGVDIRSPVTARVDLTVVDLYDRHHQLLPTGYVFASSERDWFFEPAEAMLGPALPLRNDTPVATT